MRTIQALALALSIVSTQSAYAAGSYVGTIAEVWAGDATTPTLGWLALASTMGAPSCASSSYFVLDLTQDSAKTHLSVALAALAAGKSVRLFGTGTCNGSYEWIRGIAIVG